MTVSAPEIAVSIIGSDGAADVIHTELDKVTYDEFEVRSITGLESKIVGLVDAALEDPGGGEASRHVRVSPVSI